MKKMLFLYNPKAGKGKVRASLAAIVEIFVKKNYEVTVWSTQRRGDACRMMATRASEFDRVTICGGDGTLNEAVCGAIRATEAGKQVPALGYIPAGSTNDFATSLGLPVSLLKAAEIAAEGSSFVCDAGMFNQTPFVYVAAFGAFTEVSYATPQQSKKALGHFAYVLEGIKSLSQIKGFSVTVSTDSTTFSGEYLYGMVSNTTSLGGLVDLNPDIQVELDDGLLEVALVREPKNLVEKSELMTDLLRANWASKFLTIFKTKRVSFSIERPVSWTLDGEYGGKTDTATVTVREKAYRIVIKPEPRALSAPLSSSPTDLPTHNIAN